MLIVATPKSASSSLLSTLASNSSMLCQQIFFPNLPQPDDYKILSSYHSDIRCYPDAVIQIFASPGAIYKQHIPPTPSHLEAIGGFPVVVLQRSTREIVEAYFRAEVAGIHPPRPDLAGVKSIDSWNRRADDIGLTNEIESFNHGWKQFEGNKIVIHKDDLVQDPLNTINRIQKFWGLSLSSSVKLKKTRYSRKKLIHNRGVIRSLLRACGVTG